VIARQRSDCDRDLVLASLPEPVELGLMRRIGQRQLAGERAPMLAGQLAGTEHRRGHVLPGDRTPTRRPATTGSTE
jgi:hypothetical protein